MIDIGQTVGNYKITAKLGEGGMGVVYLAEHPVIGKKVALKAIHPELSRNSEVVSRFMTEAKAVNQIGHDHIVDIADFGTTPDGDFYFIMEYLQGESLAERLKRERFLPEERALGIAAQVADALGASHRQHIIHRDLKPENIFLIQRGGSDEFVKILDFGLAKLIQEDDRSLHKTRTGSVMGTPYYMSPEQCEGRDLIDNRSDIYALGVIIFELLTGKVPFGGEGYGEIIVKHVTHPPPSMRRINPGLSLAAEQIVYRALSKNRDDRFSSMEELRLALLDPEAYVEGPEGRPTPSAVADLSGVIRAAAPMSRHRRPTPLGQPRADGSIPTPPLGNVPVPSTFRQATGEVIEELTLRRPPSRRLLYAGGGVLAAIVLLTTLATRTNEAKNQSKGGGPVSPSARAPQPADTHPKKIRINFASDPAGANVLDGKTATLLGQTPLSIEVPYADEPAEFVFQKEGFERKSTTVVPNLPVPLFVQLQAVPPASVSPAERKRAANKSTGSKTTPKHVEASGSDDTLAPSF